MSLDSKISFYNSAKDVVPSGETTIRELARMIHDGDTEAGVALVRAAATDNEKRTAKMKLPAVQISGHVAKGNRAQAIQEGRFVHSGWLQLDIDGRGLNGKTPEDARRILGDDRHVLSAFITPSGEGAKGLFRIKPCLTDQEHKQAFRDVGKYILDSYGMEIDPATKDAGRLCYIPSDRESTWNGSPVEFVQPVKTTEIPMPAANSIKKNGHSKGFPPCPEHGIHAWLMEAAWYCRLQEGMTEADTITKLEEMSGSLRRPFQPNEMADAVRKVFSSPLAPSIFDIRQQTAGELDFSRFTQTDSGNAERVHAYAGSNFRYVVESGKWLLWDGHRWNPDANGGMVRLFVSVMKETGKQAFETSDRSRADAIAKHALKSMDSNKVSAGLQLLKSILGVSVSVNDLDSDPWMIGTGDGMIDLKCGKPIVPDRCKLITKMIGTNYDATAACPTWEKFLQTVTAGNQELIGYLQAAVGYALTGSNREQCLFFLHGSGQNGKGVFSEVIKKLIGDYGQTAPESLFTKDRNQSATNDIARLSGCRMAIAAELEEGACFAEARIKSLTGGDTITARFLHQEFFDFCPTHHFWISGNHKPTVKGSDIGIWRRIRLIPFTVRISDDDKDPNLAEKLAGELPGILNWALEGCLRWQREGLRTPECVAKATDEYRAEEDVIGQFLAECTLEDRDSRTLMSTVYECYQGWAIKSGMKFPLTIRIFNRKLEDRGMQRHYTNGGRYWVGLSLK